MGISHQDMFGNLMPAKRKKRKMTIEARKILTNEEAGRLIDMDEVYAAINRTEQDGIIFLDEIDKIAGGGYGGCIRGECSGIFCR